MQLDFNNIDIYNIYVQFNKVKSADDDPSVAGCPGC